MSRLLEVWWLGPALVGAGLGILLWVVWPYLKGE